MDSNSKQLTPQDVENLLKTIPYPGFSRDIVSFGIVRGIEAQGPEVRVQLQFSTNDEAISNQVSEAIKGLLGENGVQHVDVIVEHAAPQKAADQELEKYTLPGVKHIIAVASGKGGVGKSTVAANLAIGLSKNGIKTGLIDADIYGPSVQMLLGLKDEPEPAEGENKLKPMEAFGLQAMSMGVLVDSNTPLVWRGPMVSSAVEQLLKDVNWHDLDVLVIDMPPGTGDIALTVAQKIKLDGAIIVTTPQEMALIDARKGIAMFDKVDIPVLGLVENMSYFIAPDTGKRYDIFSTGGARREALKMRVPFLGEIPLQPEIRSGSDAGKPVAATDTPAAEVFKQLGEMVWKSIQARSKTN